MKKAGSVVVIAMAILFCASAVAQQHQLVRVNIPFQFEVHQKTMPAGAYELVRISHNSAWLRAVNTSDAVVLLSPQELVRSPKVAFTFRRAGLQAYLLTVAGDGYEIKTHQTYVESRMQAKAETVVIVARGN